MARPNSPGRESPQGGILPPLVPEGGHPAACTGSRDIPLARPHCPPLLLCVCVLCLFNPVFIVQSLLYRSHLPRLDYFHLFFPYFPRLYVPRAHNNMWGCNKNRPGPWILHYNTYLLPPATVHLEMPSYPVE